MAKTGKNVKPAVYFHPGVFLEEKLQEMNISVAEFAKTSSIDESKVKRIVEGKSDIDVSTAEILEKYTEVPKYFWMKVQEKYNIYKLQKLAGTLLSTLKKNGPYEDKRQRVRLTVSKMVAMV